MIQVVCSGYRDSDNNIVKCGKVLGEKEGGDGISHTYCNDCYNAQIKAHANYAEAVTKIEEAMRITVICVDCNNIIARELPDNTTEIAHAITLHRNEAHNGERTIYELEEVEQA